MRTIAIICLTLITTGCAHLSGGTRNDGDEIVNDFGKVTFDPALREHLAPGVDHSDIVFADE